MIRARIRKQFPAGSESSSFQLNVEFEARNGVTVLFGPSGAGKTLTLDCVAGFVKPDDGRIMLNDRILYDAASGVNLPPQRRRCGYVLQSHSLFPHMTLRENLAFAAESIPRLERHRRVSEMLEQFHLTGAAGRRPFDVSGGQQQRCSIARALICRPEMLFLDEPARGLDATLREELYETLREVRKSFSIPTLLVTHHLGECFELGDQMYVLEKGRIVQSGVPRKIAEAPASTEVARLLGIYNILEMEIVTLDPQRRVSTLRYRGAVIQGPYFPGRLKGDRITVCIRPDELRAAPRDGSLRANHVASELKSAAELPHGFRLEFEEGLRVEVPYRDFEQEGNNKEWQVEFSPDRLRLISGHAETA